MHQEILVTADGSDASLSAVEEGIDLADAYGATIHALYVVDETTRGRGMIGVNSPTPFTALRQIGTKATEEIKSRCESAGIDATTAVREGIPRDEMLTYVDENDIDMIVMSSHGRTGVRRFLFGSVTEHVVRSTDRPVVVVQCQPSDSDETETATDPRSPASG